MAQVFLSYDREDAVKARAIAQALERAGHFVWWDLHIKGGAEYGREIEKALENSDAVVVLWSEKSIDSAWVRDEAAAGRDSGRLIPVLIDQASPPMGFRQYQNLNFSSWSGRGKPPGMTELLASIQALGDPSDAGARPVRTTAPQPTTRPTVSRPLKWSLIGGAVVLALTALGIVLQSDRGNRDVHTVAVAAADAAAGPLARDLLVNLGRLQSAKSGSARLVSAAGHAGNEVDLIFEIASANDGTTGADLVLMAGKDRSVLWSKDFRQESAELADLKQQLAFSAARALGCGLEGLGHDSGSLDQQILKLYLNACADLDEQFSTNAHALVPSLSRVTAKAPSFAPAWSKLLLVQAEAIEANRGPEPDPAAVRALRRTLSAAREHHPKLAEIKLSQLSLLPPHAYGERLRLADEVIADDPDNPWALAVRSNGLRAVGRLRASIEDATRAYEIDPMSPATLNAYFSALVYGGRIDAAREQLAIAERLWPRTASLEDIRFRYHLRFGDPTIALQMARSRGAEPSMMMFLEARANPAKANVERYLAYTSHVQQNVPRGLRLAFILQGWGEFNRVEEMYGQLKPWPKPEELAILGDILFRPALKSFRQDPRFMQVAKRAGLLEYWRQSGKWPDFCFEPGQPYDCEAEAAKLN